MSLSTHVLDTVLGRPAHGVAVRLEQRGPGGWALLAERVTDFDGRIADLSDGLAAGTYRLTFETDSYLRQHSTEPSFYPEVCITFHLDSAGEHYHVPLLLSPYAYSTYRGS
jgi:5-hydroxyisourate hydrolase